MRQEASVSQKATTWRRSRSEKDHEMEREHDNTQHITVLHGCSVYAVSPVSEMGVWIGLHRLSIVFATPRVTCRSRGACWMRLCSRPDYYRDPGCVVHAFSCVCVGVHLRVSPSSLWIRLTRPTPLGRPGPTQPSGARDTVVPPTGRRNMVALGQQGHQGLDPGTKIAGRQGVRQTCVQSTGAEQEGQQLKTNGAKDNNNQT